MNDANDMNQYPEGYTEDDMNPYKDIEWYDFWDETGHHTPYFDEMREYDEKQQKKEWESRNIKNIIKKKD